MSNIPPEFTPPSSASVATQLTYPAKAASSPSHPVEGGRPHSRIMSYSNYSNYSFDSPSKPIHESSEGTFLSYEAYEPSSTLHIPYRTLNSGAICPGIGYGTGGEGKATPKELYNALRVAINVGFRSFDSAPFYQDGLVEQMVGRAIRDSKIPRSEFFVTTKVWPTYARCPEESLEMSLNNFGLEYVDCLLMHWPIPLRPVPGEPYALGDNWDPGWNFNKSWAKMQELSKSKVKSIGVCNFTINRLRLLLASPSTKVVPAVLQVEGHPELPQKPLMRFCREHKIQVFCFSPLAQGQVSNPIIRQIATKHNTGSGQIALSWAIQRGTVPLPKSVSPERIRSNIQLVVLDAEDFELLDTLGEHPRRIINPRILFGHDIFENDADSYETGTENQKVDNDDEQEVEDMLPRKRKA